MNPKPEGSIGLGIGINYQNPATGLNQKSRNLKTGCGLSGSSFMMSKRCDRYKDPLLYRTS